LHLKFYKLGCGIKRRSGLTETPKDYVTSCDLARSD
jgi:hypothetical protein